MEKALLQVMIVEPGPFRTDFAGRSLAIAKRDIADYAETAGKRKERNDLHTEWTLGDPDKVARMLVDLTRHKDLPLRLLLGSDAVRLAEEHYDRLLAEMHRFVAYSLMTDEDR